MAAGPPPRRRGAPAGGAPGAAPGADQPRPNDEMVVAVMAAHLHVRVQGQPGHGEHRRGHVLRAVRGNRGPPIRRPAAPPVPSARSSRWRRSRCRSARRRCRTPGRPARSTWSARSSRAWWRCRRRSCGRGTCAEMDPVVDDPAAPWVLRFHHPDRLLRAQERAGEVGIDRPAASPCNRDLIHRAARAEDPLRCSPAG